MRAPIMALLVILALSGCIGGDDSPEPADDDDEDQEVRVTETTGSIYGTIVDNAFEPLATVEVVLIQDETTIKDTLTNSNGKYTINDVEPGNYRVHFISVCCEEEFVQVTVEAGEEHLVDHQLTRIVSEFEIYSEPQDWTGFISCSVSFPTAATPADCPGAADPNRDVRHEFETQPGLLSIVVAMVWDQTPTNTESRLRNWLFLNEGEDPENPEWQSYSRNHESSPMEFRFDFDEPVEGKMQFQFRIYSGSGSLSDIPVVATNNLGVVFQQDFTVHYHLFYGEPAPDGYSARPDA